MISRISINSSSNSSTSSATPVSNLINSWGHNPIASCVLGISPLGIVSNLSYRFTHAALLILKDELDIEDEESDILKRNGILIEYGDYNPKMADSEKNYTEKGLVIYHYEDKGGLRYYVKKYSEFIEEFGNIGYIDLNIDANNQNTFDIFINKVAKKEDNKWIQKNYSPKYFNCQNFVIEALREIKPNFNLGDVCPKDQNLAKKKI